MMRLRCGSSVTVAFVVAWLMPAGATAQTAAVPSLMASGMPASGITIDGDLGEPEWGGAASILEFVQAEPAEGSPASFTTSVQVLAGPGGSSSASLRRSGSRRHRQLQRSP